MLKWEPMGLSTGMSTTPTAKGAALLGTLDPIRFNRETSLLQLNAMALFFRTRYFCDSNVIPILLQPTITQQLCLKVFKKKRIAFLK